MSDEARPPKPPAPSREVVARCPKLGEAWNAVREEEDSGEQRRDEDRLTQLQGVVETDEVGLAHVPVAACHPRHLADDRLGDALGAGGGGGRHG